MPGHHDSPVFRDKKWMIIGDFNKILSGEEHSSSLQNPSLSQGTRDFQELTRFCSLADMGFHEPLFISCNKREKSLINKKLDRVLINNGWLYGFLQTYCVFEV